ncbi:MAG: tetratricopeptide repeat protein [Candidatus Aureabacteria bacterium]|nr:tetratricopeptide repeat protein [Candidatus Auribacterota bacterium]
MALIGLIVLGFAVYAIFSMVSSYIESKRNFENKFEHQQKTLREYIKRSAENEERSEDIFNTGEDLLRQSKLKEAIECFKKVIELKSDVFQAYLILGNIYERLSQYKEAIEIYSKLINRPSGAGVKFYSQESLPSVKKAFFQLGVNYLLTGKRDLAIQQCEILKEIDSVLADKLNDRIIEIDY